jgi:hypothetical protein
MFVHIYWNAFRSLGRIASQGLLNEGFKFSKKAGA